MSSPRPTLSRQSAPTRTADASRGTNQAGVRLYNERLVLSLVRRHGPLPKAEIARLTSLSAMTTTTIMNRLEAEGLLLRGEKQRGRVGQPAVPYALNPDGAFALGLKIGRRSSELVLVDFAGHVRSRRRTTYAYPAAAAVLGWIAGAMAEVRQEARTARTICGLGVAMPFELWTWDAEMGGPPAELQAWRGIDLEAELESLSRLPVHLCNDATAACGAELMAGVGGRYRDFVYCFIGSFVGGGLVLNHALYPGRTGNAAALGSIPVARLAADGTLSRPQLIRLASIYLLEQRLAAAGLDPSPIWASPTRWDGLEPVLDGWIADVAEAVAPALVSAAALVEAQALIVDGAFPAEVRRRMVQRINAEADRLDRRGLSPAVIVEGSIGPEARAAGAAMLPLLAAYAVDREILFKNEEVRR